MSKYMFRDLCADDIECRIKTVTEKGCMILLYKNARCDMNILDETVGPLNWQRSHTRDNANCIVSIYDESKGQWISKEDTGATGARKEEEIAMKGVASDSFKRACVNWGIGRELYTAPFIWVSANKLKTLTKTPPYKCRDEFYVSDIKIEDKKITALSIMNKTTGKNAFSMWPSQQVVPIAAEEPVEVITEPCYEESAARWYDSLEIPEATQEDLDKSKKWWLIMSKQQQAYILREYLSGIDIQQVDNRKMYIALYRYHYHKTSVG